MKSSSRRCLWLRASFRRLEKGRRLLIRQLKQLTLQNKYKEEQEVSSECEFEEGSSFDFLQEGEVEQALLDENETILSNEMN